MRAFLTSWPPEYDPEDNVTRPAGFAVHIKDDDGRDRMQFTVPQRQIGVALVEIVNVCAQSQSPWDLHQTAEHLTQIAFYMALDYRLPDEDDEPDEEED